MTESLFAQALTGGATGVIATLLLVLWLLITEKLVVGSVHKRTETKLARYEEIAFKAMTLAERATEKGGSP